MADRAGLHRSLRQRWRRQVRDATLVAARLGAPGFAPLAIDGGAAAVTSAATTAVAGAPHGAVRGLVEIDLPDGCRVGFAQGRPTAALRRMIGALVRR